MTTDSIISPRIRRIARKNLPVLLLFLLLSGVAIGLVQTHKKSAFDQACLSYIQNTLPENTLNLHYTLAHPDQFGIVSKQVRLPGYETDDNAAEIGTQFSTKGVPESDHRPTNISTTDSEHHPSNNGTTEPEADSAPDALLLALAPEDLTPSQQYLLSLYMERCQKEDALSDYNYYENILSPHSGRQVTLLTLLNEYQFYEKKDITDYLTLLSLVPDYLDSLASYTEKKLSLGLSPGSALFTDSATACRNFFSLQEILLGQSFLQKSFQNRLAESKKTLQLTDDEIKQYTLRHNALCKETLLPAYEKLAGRLDHFAEVPSPVQGLAAYPSGKDYYRALFALQTGSSLSVPETKELLLQTLSETMTTCRALLQKYPIFAEPDFAQNTEDAFPLQAPEEMLQALQKRCVKDFPALPAEVSQNMRLDLEEVSSSMQDSSAPAFYLLPPADFYDRNVIYVNPKSASSSYSLFTTLAHEGFPGHLYQTVASYATPESTTEAIFHSLLNYTGFQEGYALYCELLSYDYAGEYYRIAELPDMEAYLSYEKDNHKLQLCLLTLLEILIHDENMGSAQITDFLSRFGITGSEQIQELYQYIAAEPCCYSKYFVSYLEILRLQKTAQKMWGDTYSDLRFHTFLLTYGPADFSTLQELLKK